MGDVNLKSPGTSYFFVAHINERNTGCAMRGQRASGIFKVE